MVELSSSPREPCSLERPKGAEAATFLLYAGASEESIKSPQVLETDDVHPQSIKSHRTLSPDLASRNTDLVWGWERVGLGRTADILRHGVTVPSHTLFAGTTGSQTDQWVD